MAADRRDEYLEREAALAARDALWAAVLADDEILTTGWTAPDGTPIASSTVQDVVVEYFVADHPDDYADFVDAYSAGATSGPHTCRSGFVISPGLFDLLYEHALATLP